MSEDEEKPYPISREEALKTRSCFGTYTIDCYVMKKEGRPCKFSQECFDYTRKFNPESLKKNEWKLKLKMKKKKETCDLIEKWNSYRLIGLSRGDKAQENKGKRYVMRYLRHFLVELHLANQIELKNVKKKEVES